MDNGITNPRGSKAPDKPDDIVFINPTGGYKPDADVPIVNPTIQFMVRGTDYQNVEQRAWEVYRLFNRKNMYYIKNLYCLRSFALATPAYGGKDEAERFLFYVNIRYQLGE